MELYTKLKNCLLKEDSFRNDKKELKKWVIITKAQNFDERIIELLLEDKDLKKEFFKEVKGSLIFKQNYFIQFLEQKNYLNDSYTRYKNKVGLNIDGKFLKQRNEVALVWPYKDCILEGGQSKEEQKKDEIFFNEILAQDEITHLLEPKVLTNAKTYDKDGEHKFTGFTRDAELNKQRGLPADTITDNLIIKGNNLLALHSLKKEFAGKIKLIYIDPPYNTGNDGFKYNDNFNHSSWLTFMKNRLEIAKVLLKDDGVIFVQCDYNEQAYLKVLMDEVFGKNKFINEIIWKRKFGEAGDVRRLGTAFDNIFLYAKTENYQITLIKEKESDHVKKYIKERFTRKVESGKHKGKLWMPYPLANPGDPTKNLMYKYKGYNPPEKGWRMIKEKLEQLDNDERIYFPEDKGQRLQEKKFLDEYEGQKVNTLWTDIFVINSQAEEACNFDGQKPEDLLKRILLISTKENDIVLDFCLGSGTTAAVAHKMNRQYIGVEQMDYIEDIAVERMKKVISGEQGGISISKERYELINDRFKNLNINDIRIFNKILKEIKKEKDIIPTEYLKTLEKYFKTKKIKNEENWQGGGSFTYFELKQYNEAFIQKIQKAKDTKNLLKIWQEMKDHSFLNYNVDLKKQEENIEEFKQLTLAQQKELLCELLDKNQLYVNLSSLNDADFKCTEAEKQATKDFYKMEE